MKKLILGREMVEGFKDQQYAIHGRYASDHANEEVFLVELGATKPNTLEQFLDREQFDKRITGDIKWTNQQ